MSVFRSFSLSLSNSPGTIYLHDGRRCRDVVCREGVLVKDILDQVCRHLEPPLPPVARIFFAICDTRTGFCLNPYQTLTPGEARRQYQLRVFVNTGHNSFQLQKMSRNAHEIYYQQLREDFVHGKLYPPISINTAVWMAAIDIAKEATAKKKSFEDLTRNQSDLVKFMPPKMKKKWKRDDQMKGQLRSTFDRFYKIDEPARSLDFFVEKYLEVYEKDEMCGTHIFRLRNPTPLARPHRGPDDMYVIVVSSKYGIYRIRGRDPTKNKEDLCTIQSIQSLSVDLEALTASITKEDDDGDPSSSSNRLTLSFIKREELVAFTVVVNTYYQLLVDANAIIMEGSLKPPERWFKVGENDGFKADLCHAPIMPATVQTVLERFNLVEGHFLVRESRSSDNALTLSLCHHRQIMNFRIMRHEDGNLRFVDPPGQTQEMEERDEFTTLEELIKWHLHNKSVLPTFLKQNCCPKITGCLPLLPFPSRDSEVLSSGSDWTHPPSSTSSPGSSTPSLTSTSSPPPEVSPSEFPPPPSSSSPEPSPADPSPSKSLPSPIRMEMEAVGVSWIEYGNLEIKKELGKGHFSDVYLATLAPDSRKVAVKIPSMQLSNSQVVINDLKREIETMAKLDHPNIVKLLGITETQHFLSSIGSILMVVMEFIEGGSLRGYLEKVKYHLQMNRILVKKNIPIFLNFAKQIAEGMQYLEETKVVHRDLATRNVLVVSENQVKISDFGLARQRFENKDYYQGKNTKDLPIYWYAPECLETLKCTHKSDVWSYGVTLWEIFTFGDLPTPHLQRQILNLRPNQIFPALVAFYHQGNRLPASPLCPPEVSDIIKKCWEYQPADRPSFSDLSTEILRARLNIEM